MERDNQKEKVISVEHAKELLKKRAWKITADGTRYVWFGDNIEEYRGSYLIPISFPPVGVDKPDGYIRALVNFTTGEIGMTFDLTA